MKDSVTTEPKNTYEAMLMHLASMGTLQGQQITEEKIKFLCEMIDCLHAADQRNHRLGIAAFNA